MVGGKYTKSKTERGGKYMKLLSFKKGIHPKYYKELTRDKTIELLMPKDELVYPMQQHIGSPCKPIVKKG